MSDFPTGPPAHSDRMTTAVTDPAKSIGGELVTPRHRPKFGWEAISTGASSDDTIPVLYGKLRVGGNYINAFIDRTRRRKSYVNALVGLCEGDVESVMDIPVDVDAWDEDTIYTSGDYCTYRGRLYQSIYGLQRNKKPTRANWWKTATDVGSIDFSNKLFINGNPLSNYVKDIEVSVRLGSSDQTVMEGFESVHSHRSFSVDLDKGVQNTFVTVLAVDEIQLTFTYPNGLYRRNRGGKIKRAGSRILIEWAPDEPGFSWTTTTQDKSKKKRVLRASVGAFDKVFVIKGLGRKITHIRLTKLSRDSSGSFLINDVQLTDLDEVVHEDLAYPNTALLGLRVLATQDLNSNLPALEIEMKGRKVTNLSGTTGYSRNPVDCMLDLIQNSRYGAGEYIQTEHLNLSALQTAKDYCDDLVAAEVSGGGNEIRFRCDILIDGQGAAFDTLTRVMASWRGFPVWSDGQLRFFIDREGTPIQMFGMGNIVEGSYRQEFNSLTDIYNTIEVSFIAEDDNWEREAIVVEDGDSLALGEPVRRKQIFLPGVTRRSEALRMGRWYLASSSYNTRKITFRAATDSVQVQVGDLFWFSHDVPAWSMGSGRVASASSTTVVLGDDVTIDETESGEVLYIRNRNDDGAMEVQELERLTTPLAHWKMNDDAATPTVVDSEGSWNGTLDLQNTQDISGPGKINKCLLFNTLRYANVSTAFDIGTGDWTFAAWVDWRGGAGTQVIFSRDNLSGEGYQWAIQSSGKQYMAVAPNGGGAGSSGSANTAVDPGISTWSHVAIVKQGTTYTFYTNGVADGSFTGPAQAEGQPTGGWCQIASYNGSFGFEAQLDDLRVYLGYMSSSQIEALYAAGNGTEGQIQTRYISGVIAAGTALNLQGSWSNTPEEYDEFSIGVHSGSDDLIAKPFRAVNMARRPGGETEITGAEYYEDVYQAVGDILPPPNYSNLPDPARPPASVENIRDIYDGNFDGESKISWEIPLPSASVGPWDHVEVWLYDTLTEDLNEEDVVEEEEESEGADDDSGYHYYGVSSEDFIILKGLTVGYKYTVKLVSVSTWGLKEPFDDAPTLTFTSELGDPPKDVTGLEIEDQGNDTVWTGRDVTFTWNEVARSAPPFLGDDLNPLGAGQSVRDETFFDYEVWMRFSNDGVSYGHAVKVFVPEPRFTYTLAMNYAYGLYGVAYRYLRIDVRARDKWNRLSENPAYLEVSNPVPAAYTDLRDGTPTDDSDAEVLFYRYGYTDSGGNPRLGLKITWTPHAESDVVGYELHQQNGSSDFTPSDTTLQYKGPQTLHENLWGAPTAGRWKIAAYDDFDYDRGDLDWATIYLVPISP